MDKILILDFGSQVTQLIARRVREAGVYCELHEHDVDERFIREFGPKGIILSGSHASVTEGDPPAADPYVFRAGVPVLGICYGMQTMAAQLGGEVENGKVREFGYAEVRARGHSKLLDGIQDRANGEGHGLLDVWMSHGDKVTKLPPGFAVMAANEACPVAGMFDDARRFYAVQFHPEVTHTKQGGAIYSRFVHEICGCDRHWNMPEFAPQAIARIREQVGSEEVILGLSGGVDSAVAAALIHQAIGDQLTCIFVDTGLLRLGEGDQVMDTFAQHMGVKVDRVNASDMFYRELAGVADPEQKRRIIGRLFVEVFQAEAKKMPNAKWLAQGTIYPDVIESAGAKTKKAVTIKSHHNVGGLPESLHLKLLEPLRELFKDEVRALGIALGLPREMVYRHPFPGPGLGVRILGEVKAEYAALLQRADAIFIEELRNTRISPSPLGEGRGEGQLPLGEGRGEGRLPPGEGPGEGPANWYDKVAQAFAVFLPVRSVGVMGDGRTYDFVVALRAVETTDFMTARWAHLPYELLGRVSNRIINEVRGINRVVFDVSSKPPATIEWE
ncbi:MAG: glutamine-hydrolyzing GMP synthase [Burkholderiales bacterium]